MKRNAQKNINELQTYEKKCLTSPIIRKKQIIQARFIIFDLLDWWR